MTTALPHRELLLAHTADALMQARIACDQLHDVIIPSLPPQRRAIAEAVKHHLSKDALFAKPFLLDLEVLIDFIRSEIEKGIQATWIVDEHNVHGGHHHRHFDARSQSLAGAIGHLIDLYGAVAKVIDFAEAERLIDDML